MGKEPWGPFKVIVLSLLILNTILIGSIWLSMNTSAKFCAIKKGGSEHICPHTGKVLKGSVKGSAPQAK